MLHRKGLRRGGGAASAGAALVALALAAVVAMSAAHAGERHVKIDNFAFLPPYLAVPAGTTVVFDNADDIPHTVVATDKSFRSKALDTGDSFVVTLTAAGEIDYFCSLHPHMTGKIVVMP